MAILCNHQKTVSKKLLESLNKKEEMLEKQREYLKELEKHKAAFTAKKARIVKADTTKEVEGLKPLVCKFPENKEATATAIKKLNDKIIKEDSKYDVTQRR